MEEQLDLYIDGFQMGIGPFTVTLVLAVSPSPGAGTQAPKTLATVRMSAEHAKVMAILMRRQLKQYEETLGQPIPVAPQVYQQMGISPKEDW